MAGLVIGLALASAVFVVGPVTGAGINPALSLSPYAINAILQHSPVLGTTELAVYLAGQIAGGVIAAWLYRTFARMPAERGASRSSRSRSSRSRSSRSSQEALAARPR